MALQAPEFSAPKRTPQAALDPGNYPARVVRVIDLGLQPTTDYATKQPGKPTYMVNVTYELVDTFMVDEKGEEQLDKPRWIAEEFALKPLSLDLATSTKRMKAIDPKNELKGDWAATLGKPCLVATANYETKKNPGVTRDKVTGLSAVRARDIANMPELQNDARFFDLSDPDIEFFNSLPSWIQDKIKGNLEYAGSKLETLLEGGNPIKKVEAPKAPPVQEPVADDEPEDAPW